MSDLSRHGRRTAAADHAVLGDGDDEDELDAPRFDDAAGALLRSHRHLGLDVRVRLVAFEREILVAEREQVGHRRIEQHARQRARRARELQPRLLEMIEIEVRVAERVDELAGLRARSPAPPSCVSSA